MTATFYTLSASDCARLIADARRQPNVAWEQIRAKLSSENKTPAGLERAKQEQQKRDL